MLIITEKARLHLKKLLMTNTSDLNLGIRLKVSNGIQLGVLLDHEADGDYVVEHEGVKVLMIGPGLFALVDGAVLDTENKGSVEILVIRKGGRQPSKKVRGNRCIGELTHEL